MRKIIKIGQKEYEMQSSAFTSFKYKNETGRTLLKDLTNLGEKFNDANEKEILANWDEFEDFIYSVLRISYIMCLEAKSYVGSYENFLSETDDYLNDLTWISEVLELAISPLSRNL